MPQMPQTSDERTLTFLRAVGFHVPEVTAETLLILLRLAAVEPLPGDNRALLRMASLTAAFVRGVRDVRAGSVELDVREEAILDAALEHLRRVGCGS